MKDKFKKNIKYIVIGIVVLIVIVFAYNYFIKNNKQPVGVQEVSYENQIDEQAREILEVLDQITKINIRSEFFDDQTVAHSEGNLIPFSQLENYSSSDLPDKEFGKSNPFLVGSNLVSTSDINPFSEQQNSTDSVDNDNNQAEIGIGVSN